MRHILTVDDHAGIRCLLSVTLGRPFEITVAGNGMQALHTISSHRPRFVLRNTPMPDELSGLEVVDALQSNTSTQGTAMGMVTAPGHPFDSARARRHGAEAYFIHPLGLLQAVRSAPEHMQ